MIHIEYGIDTGKPVRIEGFDTGIDVTHKKKRCDIAAYLKKDEKTKGADEFCGKAHLRSHGVSWYLFSGFRGLPDRTRRT